MESRDRVAELARKCGLSEWADDLARVALPSVRLNLADSPGDPRGTRLGGDPALPTELDWPARRDGRLLSFVGQIRLDEVSALAVSGPVPSAGLLSFFYDAEDPPFAARHEERDRWRVVWFPDLARLQTRQVPRTHPECWTFNSHAVTWHPEWTLPPYDSPVMAAMMGLGTSYTDPVLEPRYDAYFDLQNRLNGQDLPTHTPKHRLLGYPDDIQNPMPGHCELLSRGLYFDSPLTPDLEQEIQSASTRWQLLLQVDTDGQLGTQWGDMGTVYFWAPQAAALAHDYSGAWALLQC